MTYTQLRYSFIYLVALVAIWLAGKPRTAAFLAILTLVLLALVIRTKRSLTRSLAYRFWVLSSPPKTNPSADPAFHFSNIKGLWSSPIGERLREMNYDSFLRSYYWKTIRAYVLRTKGRKCSVCKKSFQAGKLHLHHKTYINHGSEHLHLKDLQVVCQDDHQKIEREKRQWKTYC